MILAYLSYMLIVYVGITLGYHRYFSHYEFEAKPWQEIVMLYCGVLCGGRDPIGWAGVHRMHHAYSDSPQDPQGTGWKAFLSTWRVAQIPRRFVRDLYGNPRVRFFRKYRVLLWLSGILWLGPYWLTLQLLSFFGFGIINAFGHKDGQPVNRWWINLIAPGEGNHGDHHNRPYHG